MKTNKIVIIILGLIMLVSSCSSDDFDLNPEYPTEIINSWLESYEEDYGVYRPSDYKTFPDSHYRQYFKFMENNKCEYLVLSPVDAHYIENGFWEFIEDDNSIHIYNQNMELHRTLKVVSISSNHFQIGH
ncbi:hypothetical protein [Polaribacter uvawellassae]|uniref:hypothetical protein n=1 Tax=Polaribacter uvawellassae TaxID=3133495 RepID=UPI00321B4D9C